MRKNTTPTVKAYILSTYLLFNRGLKIIGNYYANMGTVHTENNGSNNF